MFGRDKQQKKIKRLDDYLRRELAKAEKEFDKAQPSRFPFSRPKPKLNPLEIRPIIVGGVNYTLQALVAYGPSFELVLISVAANLTIDIFSKYYQGLEAVIPENAGSKERLSINLVSRNNRKIDYNIAKMRFSIHKMIVAAAEFIEMGEFNSLEEVMKEDQEPSKQIKIKSLVNSQYRLHVSHRSLMISLQLFAAINQELLNKINDEKSTRSDKAHRFMVTNAIFVYEIADFIISFLQDFELQGVAELRQLQCDATSEIAQSREQILDIRQRIEERAQSGRETILNLENERRSLDDRLAAIDAVDAVWSELLQKVQVAEGGSQMFRDYIADIEIIKKNSELNLSILNLMVVTRMVRQNVEKMQQLMLEVGKLRLPAITADDVRRFFTLDTVFSGKPLIEARTERRT